MPICNKGAVSVTAKTQNIEDLIKDTNKPSNNAWTKNLQQRCSVSQNTKTQRQILTWWIEDPWRTKLEQKLCKQKGVSQSWYNISLHTHLKASDRIDCWPAKTTQRKIKTNPNNKTTSINKQTKHKTKHCKPEPWTLDSNHCHPLSLQMCGWAFRLVLIPNNYKLHIVNKTK